MKGLSPTQRTLRYIREQGWIAEKVERWNPYAGKVGARRDLFGIIDIIALAENSIIGVQSTGEAFSKHEKKILEEPLALEWLKCKGRLLLIGWRKKKLKRGGKAERYEPRIKEFTFQDFTN